MNLRDELHAIYADQGTLTPEGVKNAARPKTHPLHDRVFDKSVSSAAEAYYTSRAHHLITIARVVIRPASDTEPEQSVRAFHAVRQEDPDNNGYQYEPAEKIADDPFLRALILRDMERDWQQLKKRYEEFSEFLSMIRRDVAEGE